MLKHCAKHLQQSCFTMLHFASFCFNVASLCFDLLRFASMLLRLALFCFGLLQCCFVLLCFASVCFFLCGAILAPLRSIVLLSSAQTCSNVQTFCLTFPGNICPRFQYENCNSSLEQGGRSPSDCSPVVLFK